MLRKETLADAMVMVKGLHRSSCSTSKSGHLMKILKLTQEVQRPACLVKSKDLELQKTPRLVKERSCLQEELFKAKRDKDRLTSEKKVVLAL